MAWTRELYHFMPGGAWQNSPNHPWTLIDHMSGLGQSHHFGRWPAAGLVTARRPTRVLA